MGVKGGTIPLEKGLAVFFLKLNIYYDLAILLLSLYLRETKYTFTEGLTQECLCEVKDGTIYISIIGKMNGYNGVLLSHKE